MPTTKRLLGAFSELKTLPHVTVRLTQLINSAESTMHDFEEVIKLDPVLVSRLLRLVNSPYFGLYNKVDSIAKAVVFVGMRNLRNLVAMETIRELYLEQTTATRFSRRDLWLHSAMVAILADMIAKRIFGREGEDYFLAGIIHDIGLIIEDQMAGDLLQQALALYSLRERPLLACEQEVIGTDHCDLGAQLAREWKLPTEVLQAVRYHHDAEKEFPPADIASVLRLAEYMAGKMNYAAVPGVVEPLPDSLVRHVRRKMADYKVITRDLPQEMARARDLYQVD